MTELGRLIETASRANHGRSMQDAADLATRLGAPISKSHISKNARRVQSVTPQLIRGIAAGYGIEPEDVVRAALADLGFAIPDYTPSPESAIRRDPDLGVQAKAILLAAVSAARQSFDEPQGRAGRDRVRAAFARQGVGVEDAEHRGEHRG